MAADSFLLTDDVAVTPDNGLLQADPHGDVNLTQADFLYFYTPDNDYGRGCVNCGHNSSANQNTSHVTNHTIVDRRDEDLARIEITVQIIIFALSLMGNSLLIFALRYRKKKTSRLHMYILHLAIADLLVAFCNILPQLAWDITFRFQGNDFLCRLVKYLQVLVIYLSTYILVATAIDRYRSICSPLAVYNWSPRKVHITIAIAWLLSCLLALPQVFIFKKRQILPGVTECWASFRPEWTLVVYITTFSVSVYIVPCILLALLYGRICYEVCKNFNTERKFPLIGYKSNSSGIIYKFNGSGHISVIGNSHSGGSNEGRGSGSNYTSCPQNSRRHTSHKAISRTKLKTVKLTVVVVIAYIVCWSPFMITQMWWAYDEHAPYNDGLFVVCLLLASLNSCVNPWIYMAFSGNMLKQIFPCCLLCSNRCPSRSKGGAGRRPSVEAIQNKHGVIVNGGGAGAMTVGDNKASKLSSARARLSSLRNTLFSRSQSTKMTGATSDNMRYRVNLNNMADMGNNMLKSSENGLRINRVTAPTAGVGVVGGGPVNNYLQYRDCNALPCVRADGGSSSSRGSSRSDGSSVPCGANRCSRNNSGSGTCGASAASRRKQFSSSKDSNKTLPYFYQSTPSNRVKSDIMNTPL